MAQVVAYVRFAGRCREAFEFYKACLGGEFVIMQTIGESPMADQWPAEAQNKVLHVELSRNGLRLMGSDMIGPDEVINGNTFSLCLVCSSAEEIKTLFANLSAGGEVTHPLVEEFFGTFGDLTDKFGVSWMFQYGPAAAG